jgi:hypothetical protein
MQSARDKIKQLSNTLREGATVDSNQEPENQIDLRGGVSQMGVRPAREGIR